VGPCSPLRSSHRVQLAVERAVQQCREERPLDLFRRTSFVRPARTPIEGDARVAEDQLVVVATT
jgi:hypothetical protein